MSLTRLLLCHVKWAPVTTTWCILSFGIENTATRYGGEYIE